MNRAGRWRPFVVAISSAAFLFAAAEHASADSSQSLTWSTSATTNPAGSANGNVLTGVSCISPSFCMAVGYYFPPSTGGSQQTLAETWNGSTWSQSATTDPGGMYQNTALWGVSCTSPSFCVAVGSYFDGTNWQGMAENWDGSEWKTTADSGTALGQGVSCASPDFCVAEDPGESAAEIWNGSSWSTSGPGGGQYGVACTSAVFCVAVGNIGSPTNPLAAMWNGSTWSTSAMQYPGSSPDHVFTGVSCTDPDFCVAVGPDPLKGPLHGLETIAETWDGSGWSRSATPDPGGSGDSSSNLLDGVSCPTSNFCVAAGAYYNGTHEQTLSLVWDGSNWSVLPTTDPGGSANDNLLEGGISCPDVNFCVAVGQYNDGTALQTLAEVGTSAASGPTGTSGTTGTTGSTSTTAATTTTTAPTSTTTTPAPPDTLGNTGSSPPSSQPTGPTGTTGSGVPAVATPPGPLPTVANPATEGPCIPVVSTSGEARLCVQSYLSGSSTPGGAVINEGGSEQAFTDQWPSGGTLSTNTGGYAQVDSPSTGSTAFLSPDTVATWSDATLQGSADLARYSCTVADKCLLESSKSMEEVLLKSLLPLVEGQPVESALSRPACW